MRNFIRFSSLASASSRQRAAVSLHWSFTPAVQGSTADSEAAPIVFLHGLLGSESTYRSMLRRQDFAPRHDKLGVDIVNHGRSPRAMAADMTYEGMSDDVVRLLDERGTDDAILIGHSVGGKVACCTALRHPDRVRKLVVVDILPIAYRPDPRDPADTSNVLRTLSGVDLSHVSRRPDADALLQEAGLDSEPLRQFLLTNLVKSDDDKYQWKMNVAEIAKAMPQLLSFPTNAMAGRSFEKDTCMIRGGKSKYVPFQHMKSFINYFPNTKLVTISQAGHWVPAQMPDQFCQSVNDFI